MVLYNDQFILEIPQLSQNLFSYDWFVQTRIPTAACVALGRYISSVSFNLKWSLQLSLLLFFIPPICLNQVRGLVECPTLEICLLASLKCYQKVMWMWILLLSFEVPLNPCFSGTLDSFVANGGSQSEFSGAGFSKLVWGPGLLQRSPSLSHLFFLCPPLMPLPRHSSLTMTPSAVF